MFLEKMGGTNTQAHAEIWGTNAEMLELELEEDKIDELANLKCDVIYFCKDEAEVYYLDKELKQFKKIGE